MQIAVLVLIIAGFACWCGLIILKSLFDGLSSFVSEITKSAKGYLAQRQAQKKQTALKAENARIEAFRRSHPVQITGVPDITLLRKISAQLDTLIQRLRSHRPAFSTLDERFRTVRFRYPFEVIFPRKNSDGNGPDPAVWHTTPESLKINDGNLLKPIYLGLAEASLFPVNEPTIVFNQTPAPALPNLQIPSWDIKLFDESGAEIDTQADASAKAYAPEISQANKLRTTAGGLRKEIDQKWQVAKKEKHAADQYSIKQNARLVQLRQSVSHDYQAHKTLFEREAASELEPLKIIYNAYQLQTQEGIQQHFSLGLETVSLPIPPAYPWRVFYNREERLVQVNQRVPLPADVLVKRPDSNRPLAKRDIDNFLRRFIPAISLHIAANVAANDMLDEIDAIAVNCWSRYFEKSTGRLKDAFVSALQVEKRAVIEMNFHRADPLDAFRALRGAFVFSSEDIVPIEPQIRLDKQDSRFVQGKDILDGMAQGQNLATMDWQDFEHLIRELLAKEFGKDGSEVKITRASRDRGVDAVVFNPDPLRGGKYVVQAKRYNNLVDVSAVRDLYGTMLNEGAARGILVTTSRYGRDAYDFASNKPISLIDGQNLLALLAQHGYNFNIKLV